MEGVIGATYVHAIENGILSYTDQIPGDYGQIVGKGDKGASANLRSHETPKKVWQFCAFHCFHDRQNKDELLKQSQTFEACHLPTPDWPNTIFDGAQEQVLDSPHQNETREQFITAATRKNDTRNKTENSESELHTGEGSLAFCRGQAMIRKTRNGP